MLALEAVGRRFGGLLAVNRVTMRVDAGQVVGLIGPNGAGKTTLINLISGLDTPTAGQIWLDDQTIHRLPPHRINQCGIARTYQNIRLFSEMTALENIMIGQHGRGRITVLEALAFSPRHLQEEKRLHQAAHAWLDRFGLADVAHIPAGTLAYGDQRRLEMARALATQPKLLLLDEPTAGMNPTETHELGEQILRIKQDGLSVLVIEHDMSLIHQVCDVVYVLNFGEVIAFGTPDEIRQNPTVIEAYLGREEVR